MKQLVIVTGLSGSGKSIALRALEDSGYYCIDNLPATMLPHIAEHLQANGGQSAHLNSESHDRVAISIDSPVPQSRHCRHILNSSDRKNIDTQVLFLESNVETLV